MERDRFIKSVMTDKPSEVETAKEPSRVKPSLEPAAAVTGTHVMYTRDRTIEDKSMLPSSPIVINKIFPLV